MSSQGPTRGSEPSHTAPAATSPFPSSAPIAIAFVPAYKELTSKPTASSVPTSIPNRNPVTDDTSDDSKFVLGSSPIQFGRRRYFGV